MHIHDDADLFREAVNYTMASTGFLSRLIEKDYFCSLLLEHLAEGNDALFFKGGTCLAKVHAEFYRLSEDLDFTIPTPVTASRSERSRRAAGLKTSVIAIAQRHPIFHLVQNLTGENNSAQYTAVLGYTSLVTGQEENIKIQVALREPLLRPGADVSAHTLLLDPVSDRPMVEPVRVRCISSLEAFAEKFRAALSRRDAAIRDFYDVAYAVGKMGLRPDDGDFVDLIRQKLTVPGNEPVDVSESCFILLRRQTEAQLKPVLRPKDFAEFNPNRAFLLVTEMARRLAES
jgi:predicted nucleotidyltransferase component of viral defense system